MRSTRAGAGESGLGDGGVAGGGDAPHDSRATLRRARADGIGIDIGARLVAVAGAARGRGRSGQCRPDEVARDAHGVAARRREHELHLDRVAVDVGPLERARVDELPALAEVRRNSDCVGRAPVWKSTSESVAVEPKPSQPHNFPSLAVVRH